MRFERALGLGLSGCAAALLVSPVHLPMGRFLVSSLCEGGIHIIPLSGKGGPPADEDCARACHVFCTRKRTLPTDPEEA